MLSHAKHSDSNCLIASASSSGCNLTCTVVIVQAKEAGTSQEIAMLAAEVERLRRENTIVEHEAGRLKAALAVTANGSTEVALLAHAVLACISAL